MSFRPLFEPRSILFVPADAQAFIAKAAMRGADAIVLDLEDGVAPSAKQEARAMLVGALRQLKQCDATVYVRINHVTSLLRDDLLAAVAAGADGIVVPKVDTPEQLAQIDALLRHAEAAAPAAALAMGILGLVESPLGIVHAAAIAKASPRLVALCFGSEDLAAAMGVEPSPESLSWPAQAMAIAAMAAGLVPLGLPGSVANFTDLTAYRATVQHARRLGMRGATCIHPAQIPILNDVFGASEQEALEAERVVAVFDAALRAGKGAVALDGRMVDEPVANRARTLLRRRARHAAPRLAEGAP